MPFYEYECASCKFYTEVMQKISDAPLKKCPSCGKSTMKKLISAPVFRLKGGGWYETDFKSDKESKRNLAGDSEGSDSKPREAAAPADAKAGDSKPADSKSESKPAPAEKSSVSEPGASRSARKSAGRPAAKPTGKPAAKAPVRKPAPKAKAKAAKRRGR
jgi:putative FmdB family regulatory protein